jgi:lipopolysaccharide transport system permease protein
MTDASDILPRDIDDVEQRPIAPPTKAYQGPVVRIRPAGKWPSLDLPAIWEYRDLLYLLAWRDIKIRYKQTGLGAAWAVIQPFLTMLIFSLVFGRVARVSTGPVPYPLFCFSALVPWMFFANGVTQSSNCLVSNANLLTKVYFPRIVVPISSVGSGLLDFALAFLVLLGMMVFYQVAPSGRILWLPVFLLLAAVTALGVGLWLSAMNVRFRDVRYTVPFLVQLWMYATPIGYPANLISEKWRIVYSLNPMVGVAEGVRWALFGMPITSGSGIALSVGVSLLILATGAVYFRHTEKSFADLI